MEIPIQRMVDDIKHAMEMYPKEEVDRIIYILEAHEKLLDILKKSLGG